MKKILIIAVMMLAATSLSLGHTRDDGTGKPGVSTSQTGMRTVGENTAQCTMTFLTESLPGFPLGEPANFKIEACCGTPPYHFALVQGTLPEGLHLNQNGRITGKPTEEADTTIFVRLTDNGGCSLTQAFAVRVDPS